MMRRFLSQSLFTVLLCLALVVAGCQQPVSAEAGQPEQAFAGDQRVLILGDSISQNGTYAVYLDGYLQTRFPEQRTDIINVGLSSETASGLSEPGHPGRRPHVHDRLDSALSKVQPDVVMVFYGMNDAIYMPFDSERFAAYREGMRHVIDRIEQAGARPILMTPPPFDPLPIADKVAPIDAEKHGYQSPYEGYDYVLARYGEWLLSLREEGYLVVNVGDESREHVLDRHAVDPDYTLAGDGVHPNAFGHWMITQAILKDADLPAEVDVVEIDAATGEAPPHVRDLRAADGELEFVWVSRVPMPMDADWPDELIEQERIIERFNRHLLRVTNLPHARYELYEGEDRLGTFSRDALASGLNLAAFEELPTNRHAAEIGPLVKQRQQMLAKAWRQYVAGDIDADALNEVEVEAGAIEREIRDLAQPVALKLHLVPAEGDD